MIEAFLTLLTLGCISMSVRLTLVNRRLKKAEAILQKVVSVVAMADPEHFKLLVEAPKPKSRSKGDDRDKRVNELEESISVVPAHDREEALAAIVRLNPWMNQSQFNRLLCHVPEHDRGEALQHYTINSRESEK